MPTGVSLYMIKTLCFLIILGFSHSGWTKVIHKEKTAKANIQVELVAEDLGVVWGMAFLNNEEIIFTERGGEMGVVSLKTGKVQAISHVPNVQNVGQGGLLDVAIPPGFKPGGWIYLTYVKEQNGGVTTLARAKVANGKIDQWEDIFVTQSASNTNRHFGSRIVFDDKGFLFFTVGDRGVRATAQDLQKHNGSVLRLHLDGSTPKDNPFSKNKNALPEIWSYGHRNPQGIVLDKENNRLWINEHGPRGGDEINLVLPGLNYGWPTISYGKEYWGPKRVGEGTHKTGMEQPKKVYTPSIAPGSLLLYRGKVFSQWSGNLFSGALKLTHINRVEVDDKGELKNEERLLDDFGERIRALVQGPDEFIYFSTDSGKILRLVPAK